MLLVGDNLILISLFGAVVAFLGILLLKMRGDMAILKQHLDYSQQASTQRLLDFLITQAENNNANFRYLTQDIENRFNAIGHNIDDKFYRLQLESNEKLEKIRQTVDEKLHETLEARLGQTFQLVAERLEIMHRGIGEMQSLASGVGDLKRILSNVKTRGVWGEAQLEGILEQLLTKSQYAKNVVIKKGSAENVEFAIKLPSKNGGIPILLPIDAKLPLDIYQNLVQAQEIADIELVGRYTKELENAIKRQARNISTKYIEPPITTEFAIMFVPIEGLYAEILRITGLMEVVQHEYKVIITGPTTFSAIVSTLQIGYRAVAIQQRSSEVWGMLTVVRKEFARFMDLLSKTRLKLDQASKVIGEAESKTRNIQKHLKNIEFDKEVEDNAYLSDINKINDSLT